MNRLLTQTAKRAKGKVALTLLGVLGVFVATAVVFAATRGGDFTLSVPGANHTVTAGNSASYIVKVKRIRGFKGAIKLGVTGMPRNARPSWRGGAAAASTTVKKNVTSATLTIVTTSSTPVGTFKPTVTAKSGRLKHTKKVQIVVQAAPVTGGGGGTGSGGGGTGTPSSTPSAPAEPTFAIGATPASQSVIDGESTNFDVTVNRAGGYTGAVAFAVTGLPSGATGTFTPVSTAGNSSTLAVATNGSTASGTYGLVVTGTGGGTSSAQNLTLVVDHGQAFALAGTASGLSPGTTQPLNLTVQNPNNFAIKITSLTVTASSTSNNAACPVGSNFSVTPITSSAVESPAGTFHITVPAHSGPTSLTALGVSASDLPKVTMINDPSNNQAACMGVTVNFNYGGGARD